MTREATAKRHACALAELAQEHDPTDFSRWWQQLTPDQQQDTAYALALALDRDRTRNQLWPDEKGIDKRRRQRLRDQSHVRTSFFPNAPPVERLQLDDRQALVVGLSRRGATPEAIADELRIPIELVLLARKRGGVTSSRQE